MMNKANRLWVAHCLAILIGLTNAGALAQSGHGAVFCYNESLGTVVETLASDCKGRIVTEEEADAARNRRQDYIRKVLTKAPDSRLQGKTLAGQGSGFFVSDDGSVLTNAHVVADCSAITVTPTFGEMAVATGVVPAQTADLALVRTGMAPPGIAPFAEGSGPAVLRSAFILGYPEHGMTSVTPILTAVEVLHRQSHTTHGPAIVVRGDVRRGNSGGPLLDSAGNVVGVITAKVNSVNVFNATGAVVRDIALALPGDRALSFLEGQGIDYQRNQRQPVLAADRMLLDARPFMAQIGCWK